MNVIKVCKHHGPLSLKDVSINKRIDRGPNAFYIRCKLCHKKSSSNSRKEARRLYREGLTDKRYSSDLKVTEDRKNNPEKYREWSRKSRAKKGDLRNREEICRRANISLEEYYSLLESQNHLCYLCQKPEKRMQKGKITHLGLNICPFTKRHKKFLCFACSTSLGLFGYCKETIRSAIAYLKGNINEQ